MTCKYGFFIQIKILSVAKENNIALANKETSAPIGSSRFFLENYDRPTHQPMTDKPTNKPTRPTNQPTDEHERGL